MVPPSARLGQLLTAWTIEVDNTFERAIRDVRAERGIRGPWLISVPSWGNLLRHIPADGCRLVELEEQVALINLSGLQRWGYVSVVPADRPASVRRQAVITLSGPGRYANAIWARVVPAVERRWRERFGPLVDELVAALTPFAQSGPAYLPVVGFADGMQQPDSAPTMTADSVLSLLSRVMYSFAASYEAGAELSLTMAADVVRVLELDEVAVRDLPRLSGVSKEGIAAALGFLTKRGFVQVSSGTGRAASLTVAGRHKLHEYHQRVAAVQAEWELPDAAKPILEHPLFTDGLRPPDGCWRASKPYLTQTMRILVDPGLALPWFPMVLHRGGFPDAA